MTYKVALPPESKPNENYIGLSYPRNTGDTGDRAGGNTRKSRRYEVFPNHFPHHYDDQTGEQTGGVAAPQRLRLSVRRVREVPPPIRLGLGVTVVDPGRFVEADLGDLEAYVAAKNKGSAKHLMENLLEEKLEHLGLCGIEVEIKCTE